VRQAGAVVVGGHSVRDTEIKFGLAVTGIVDPDHLITNQQARPGDSLILTKALGTGAITTAAKGEKCPAEILQGAVDSMIQLNSIGSQAARQVNARAATDITGFGLAGHACELASASKVTLAIEVERLPILAGAYDLVAGGSKTRANASNRSFCQPLMRVADSVDPVLLELLFDAQTSGGLLISVAADRADALIDLVRAGGAMAFCRIGTVCERQDVNLLVM
jgi:selenide,water dikinase